MAFKEPAKMPEETKALLAQNRKDKRERESKQRLQRMAEGNRNGAPSWRELQLRRYILRVLALKGHARLEFMEAHPISGLFR